MAVATEAGSVACREKKTKIGEEWLEVGLGVKKRKGKEGDERKREKGEMNERKDRETQRRQQPRTRFR